MKVPKKTDELQFQHTFICESYDKQEAVNIIFFYKLHCSEKTNTQPFLKIHESKCLGSFSLLNFPCFYFPLLWKCTYVQRECSSVEHKGRELHTSTATWSQISCWRSAFLQTKPDGERTNLSLAGKHGAKSNLHCCVLIFSFHCILLLCKKQEFLKSKLVI